MLITKIAWLGHKNYGDDLMAKAIQDHLEGKYGRYREYVWCEGNVDVNEFSGPIAPKVGWPGSLKKLVIWLRLLKSDALVLGGGSILHSINSVAWKRQGLRIFKFFHPRKPAVGVSLSLGPFESSKAEELCRSLVERLDSISLRDQVSYDKVCSWGLEHKAVRTIDIAANSLESSANISLESRDHNESTPSRIGISLVTKNISKSKRELYKELVRKLSQNYESVVLLNLCDSEVFGDEKVLGEIAKEVDADNVDLVSYRGGVEDFNAKLLECDFIIGERLHSIIAAFFLGIPFISISYHEKCRSFFKETGLPERYLFDSDNVDVDRVIDAVEIYDVSGRNSSLREMSKLNYKALRFDELT